MFSDLPGVSFPLIQAPMAGVQVVELALAVCSAGALGSLPSAMLDLQALRESLERFQARSACVNINFFCHEPPKPDAVRDAAWRAASIVPGPERMRIQPLRAGLSRSGPAGLSGVRRISAGTAAAARPRPPG